MIELLKKRLLSVKGKTILELGAGYMEDFREIVAFNNDYIVSDIETLDLCPDKAQKIRIKRIDACNIALESQSIDIVCSSMLLRYVDLAKHIKEVQRVLKSDGCYLAAVTGLKNNKELKLYGYDPKIDMDQKYLEGYGFNLIEEECYKETFLSQDQAIRYCSRIGIPISVAREVQGLTKHYLLLELR